MRNERELTHPKILAISGFKNSGKTTLITKIIPRLAELGLKVATIKHDGHDFEADREETDTYKHMEAGAVGSAIFSDNKYMIVNRKSIDETYLFTEFNCADLILIEGMKDSLYPKIELLRGDKQPICENVLAIVSDMEHDSYINWNDMDSIVNVICIYLEKEDVHG